MHCVKFHLHHDTQILLSPKHNISTTDIVTNCALTGEGNLWEGCGIWDTAEQ